MQTAVPPLYAVEIEEGPPLSQGSGPLLAETQLW